MSFLPIDEAQVLVDGKAVCGAARERDVAILELLYATGLRVSELSSLDIEDVDRAGATVRVLGKGRKERIVPFGRRAASALDAYLGPRAERRGTLFTNHRGGRLSVRAIHAIVREHRKLGVASVAGELSAKLRGIADEYLTAVNQDRPEHLIGHEQVPKIRPAVPAARPAIAALLDGPLGGAVDGVGDVQVPLAHEQVAGDQCAAVELLLTDDQRRIAIEEHPLVIADDAR